MRFVGLGQKYAIFQATTSINARAFYITTCCFGSWSTKRKHFAECSIILLSTLSELATVHQLNLPAPSFQASRFSRLSRLNFFIKTRSESKLAFTKKKEVLDANIVLFHVIVVFLAFESFFPHFGARPRGCHPSFS